MNETFEYNPFKVVPFATGITTELRRPWRALELYFDELTKTELIGLV